MSACNRCGQEIVWARDEARGKWISVEPWSIDDGSDVPYSGGIRLKPHHVVHFRMCTAGGRAAETKASQAQSRPGDGPWAALWLANGAPPEVITAAYRALARIHHPDVGGSEEQMKKINDAHESLTRKRRKAAL